MVSPGIERLVPTQTAFEHWHQEHHARMQDPSDPAFRPDPTSADSQTPGSTSTSVNSTWDGRESGRDVQDRIEHPNRPLDDPATLGDPCHGGLVYNCPYPIPPLNHSDSAKQPGPVVGPPEAALGFRMGKLMNPRVHRRILNSIQFMTYGSILASQAAWRRTTNPTKVTRTIRILPPLNPIQIHRTTETRPPWTQRQVMHISFGAMTFQ